MANAAENKGTPQSFLQTFLSRPASSIPKGAQWAVTFNDLAASILPAIKAAYAREPGTGLWKTDEAASVILTDQYQTSKGCLFCQAIGLPGETINTNVESKIERGGFIASPVGGGRANFPNMRMTFLDTSVSFCDSFLRGWALATAHFGMVARSGEKNFRTGLTCWKFGITPQGPIVLQKMSFDGICCIGVSEEEYTYTPLTSPVNREATFVYHSYSLETTKVDNPAPYDPPAPTMAQSGLATQSGIAGAGMIS